MFRFSAADDTPGPWRPIMQEEVGVESNDALSLKGNCTGDEPRRRMVDQINGAFDGDRDRLVVDMSEVTSVDFDYLTGLMSLQRRIAREGGHMDIRGVPESVRQVIKAFRIPWADGRGDGT